MSATYVLLGSINIDGVYINMYLNKDKIKCSLVECSCYYLVKCIAICLFCVCFRQLCGCIATSVSTLVAPIYLMLMIYPNLQTQPGHPWILGCYTNDLQLFKLSVC